MSSDPYLDVIHEHWQHIAMMYDRFRGREQVIELDVAEERIYSYPAADYIGNLSERTRDRAAAEFAEATANNSFLLFVCDTRNRRLRSYVFDVPERIFDQTGDVTPQIELLMQIKQRASKPVEGGKAPKKSGVRSRRKRES
jgi:hypothetical protein